MIYSFLADVVVAIHLAYVSFVIFGQLAILVGIVFRWGWIRNLWFRSLHLLAIVIVAVEAILNITCPLTTLEYNLRLWAGQNAEEGSFIGRMLHDMMFFTAPQWVFTTCYVSFAAIVIGTFVLAPPRLRRRHAPSPAPEEHTVTTLKVSVEPPVTAPGTAPQPAPNGETQDLVPANGSGPRETTFVRH